MSAYAIQSSVLDIRNRSASLRGYPSLAEMKEKELVLAGDEHIMNEFQQEIDFRSVSQSCLHWCYVYWHDTGCARCDKMTSPSSDGSTQPVRPCLQQAQLRRMFEHAKARRLGMERQTDLMRQRLRDAAELQDQADRVLMVSKEEVRRVKEKIRAAMREIARKETDREDQLFQRREELGDILAVRSMRRKNAQRRRDIRAGVDGDLDADAESALIEEANQITLKQTTLATFSKSVKSEINKCQS